MALHLRGDRLHRRRLRGTRGRRPRASRGGRPGRFPGGWGQRVVALVQPAPGAEPGPGLAADLLAHCVPRLARLKHPRVIEYRDRLPRTPTGKLSRSNLRETYLPL
ncbi:AMP-binding enzyme [Streptosporangium album]|uniref:AMP-binding enzyme n=1 Tax=Streptosporangium album TaxID=47479 RepID=UPI0035E3FC5F